MLELNTSESQFVHKILLLNSLREYFDAQVRGITTESFTEDSPRNAWNFIQKHVQQYNKLPSLRAVQEQVPLFTPGPVEDEFQFYRDKLIKQSQKNTMAKFIQDLAIMVQEDDDKALEYIGETYSNLIKGARISDYGKFRDMYDRIIEYEHKKIAGIPTAGVPTGITELDEHFLGFRPGDFAVLSGRMGEGKTTVALFWAFSAFMQGYKVSYITLEMPREQIFEKLDALATGISVNKIKRLNLTDEDLEKYRKKAELIKERKSDIFVHDRTGACSLVTVEAILNQDEPDILYIDSIYLMKGSRNTSDWEKIKEISNNLKQLAMKYRKPIIVISQVNRIGEEMIRAGQLPSLAHLSYSDAIGQDVDHAFVLTSNEKTRIHKLKRLSTMKLRGSAEKDIAIEWEPMTNFIKYYDEYSKLRMPDEDVQKVLDLQKSMKEGGPFNVNTRRTSET